MNLFKYMDNRKINLSLLDRVKNKASRNRNLNSNKKALNLLNGFCKIEICSFRELWQTLTNLKMHLMFRFINN